MKSFLRACLDTTVQFRSPIQMAFFLPFQNGENGIFTAETVAQRKGPIFDQTGPYLSSLRRWDEAEVLRASREERPERADIGLRFRCLMTPMGGGGVEERKKRRRKEAMPRAMLIPKYEG